jgi:hypothetical protein
MSLAYDLHAIVNGVEKQTNFGTMLLHLIFKADEHNVEKIRKGFPEAVALVEHYQKTGEIKETNDKQPTDITPGYYWAQRKGSDLEREVVQVVEDSAERFTVYACGDDCGYDIEEFEFIEELRG